MTAKRRTHPKPHLLVIDDDPLFRAMVRRVANLKEIDVTVCSSLKEIDAMTAPHLFDVAVVDYYLDSLQENLTGSDIAHVMESTPILFISNSDSCISDNQNWPEAVRKFVNKRIGIHKILDTALSMGARAQNLGGGI